MILAALDEILENFADLEALKTSIPLLRTGLVNTLKLVGAAFGVALLVGVPVVAGAMHRNRLVRGATNVYIDGLRATPPVVTLLLVFYVLPGVGGPTLTAFQAAVLAFGFIQGAYVGEIYRGVLAALSHGQLEAAHSIGLSWIKTARLVVAPQLVRIAVPPLTNQVTLLVRDSALALFIGYPELLTQARQARALTQNASPLLAVALIYGFLMITFQLISNRVERRLYSEYVK